jgi:hypothetical protein
MQSLREMHSEEESQNSNQNGVATEARTPSPELIREQLERLLSSPRFSSSPRCQFLLRYVVEQSLKGHTSSLKERNIGVEIFKRDAAYDTNADPVVRVAVSEVRKKLAQYYYEPDSQGQVRIKLPTGSYVPEYSVPAPVPAALPAAKAEPRQEEQHRNGATAELSAGLGAGLGSVAGSVQGSVQGSVTVAPIPAPTLEKRAPAMGKLPWFAAAAAFVAVLATAAIFLTAGLAKGPLDEFWAPFVKSANPVLICMGQLRASRVELDPNPSLNPAATPDLIGAGGNFPHQLPVSELDDAITVAEIAGLLRADRKPFNIRGEGTTTYADLQKGPVILLGAFDNDWTMRLTRHMRFRLNQDGKEGAWWISDQKNPTARIGYTKLDGSIPLTQDMALVVRAFDPETKQPAIVVAGISPPGTTAAGEFVTNQALLGDFLKTLPADWKNKNMELLLSTNVVEGQPGPPHVVASDIW